jgi:hypothetical protein
MPASATHRRERAIIAALTAAGAPLGFKALVQAAVALGPDAPQVVTTIPRMLRDGSLWILPGTPKGTALRYLTLCLPGTPAPVLPDPAAAPATPAPRPAHLWVPDDVLPTPEAFRAPVSTTAPDMPPTLLAPLVAQALTLPLNTPVPSPVAPPAAPEPVASPVEPTAPAPDAPRRKSAKRKLTARDGLAAKYTGIGLTPDATAALGSVKDDLSTTLGFAVTSSQAVLHLFKLYSEARR